MNQDLLETPDDTYVPIGAEGTKSVICSRVTDDYESKYNFEIKDDTINRIAIMYKTNVEDIDAYSAASSINQIISYQKLQGLSVTMYGGLTDFSLNVNVNPSDYDKARVEEMSDDFSKILMVIDSITDIELYKKALEFDGNTYTCE